ncbi:MAG TPA: penicillin-binding transpeptidase domain-containing protein [Cellulomonas sp.]|uniref:penicillin-binding transpeptidase domain-containing protein n=1 Tax=Cellulomonas sp. TaxID=40001 RepID=UPI002E323BE5|nr:penicillin-binding transpeptidase domain-containing protein [Cellulomonas sp.]HEX5333600.1 penicillin-binding transpeptidase domain-containing protein [Cellulomonas sp.]
MARSSTVVGSTAASSSPGSTWRRATGVALVAALAVAGLAACTASKPGPEGSAKALATAISTGDFTKVTLTGATATEAAAERTTAFDGLKPWEPRVEVKDVATTKDAPDAATATLAFTWDVDASDTDWTYTTTARLARVEDAWQAAWSPFLLAPDLVAGEVLGAQRIAAERAGVVSASGDPIVTGRDVVRVGVDKTHVAAAAQDAAARALAQALGMDVDAYAARVAAAGEKAFVEALVVRSNDASYDLTAIQKLAGVNLVTDSLPLAPTRRFARPILGTVGEATAEIVDASNGAIKAGDLTGLSGLQREFDAQLRGLPGLTIAATSTISGASRELFHSDPTPGTPLVLTLDTTLQDAAEGILADVVPASAIVAIRPSTGDVLVAASGPGGDGLSTATMGKYAPGSTFKLASALALLRSGMTPDTAVTCPETVTVDGREFSNYPGYPTNRLGQITLLSALANSCNTAFIGARDAAPQAALADAAASLGLGVGGATGFPAYLGSVPATAEGTDHAASMIGQGRVEASPLAMARVAASIAQGTLVTPRLVVPAAGGTTAGVAASDAATNVATDAATSDSTGAAPTSVPGAPLTAAEASALRDMMRAVVTDGSGALLLDVPGAPVLAKSGTAQFGADGDLRNHVWMLAIQGDLAVAVFVDEGDYGSTTSGPLLKRFLVAAAS